MARNKFLKTKNWLKLGSAYARLLFGFGGVAVAFMLILSLVGFVLWNENTYQEKITHLYQPTEYYAHLQTAGILENESLLQQAVFSAKPNYQRSAQVTAIQVEELWENQILPSLDTLDGFSRAFQKTEIRDLYLEIKKKSTQLYQASQQALQATREEKIVPYQTETPQPNALYPVPPRQYFNAELASRMEMSVLPLSKDLKELLRELVLKSQIAKASLRLHTQNRTVYLAYLIAGLFLLTFGGMVLVVRHIHQRNTVNIKSLNDYTKSLLRGEIPPRVSTTSREYKALSTKLNHLRNYLDELKDFALEVGEGKYDHRAELFGESGDLGQALAAMQKGLLKVSRENTIRYWTNNGIAKFSEILTKNADHLDQLAHTVISELVQYLGINQGGFFVVENTQDSPEEAFLELKASYAYNKKKFIEKKIYKGQGLLGQAWQERELSLVREIPEDYVEITSGLGAATPRSLLIVPLKSNQAVLGLLELASFQEMNDQQINLVKKIADNIGQALAAFKSNEQTRQLLVESQDLTKTLQAQEEQMRENMIELQDTQRLMNRTQKELAEKEANLDALINNTSHAIVAFDKHYKITVVNRAMRQLYMESGIRLEVGKNLLEEIPSEEVAKHQEEYQRALAGEKYEVLRTSEKYGQKFFYELHYNPIRDEEREVIGASIFIENITDQKLAEINLKETQANLTSLINDTEDHIMALDDHYRVIVVNEATIQEYRERGLELKRGNSIFNYLTSQEEKRWKQYYDRALSGERFRKVFESGSFPDKTYWEHWFNPIRDEYERVTGFSVFSRNVTEAKRAEIRIRQLLLESLEATESLKTKEQEMREQMQIYETRIQELEAAQGIHSSSPSPEKEANATQDSSGN